MWLLQYSCPCGRCFCNRGCDWKCNVCGSFHNFPVRGEDQQYGCQTKKWNQEGFEEEGEEDQESPYSIQHVCPAKIQDSQRV